MNLIDLLKELWAYIGRRRRLQLWGILGLTILSTVAELISIGAVIPFLAAVSAPEVLLSNPRASGLLATIGVRQPEQVIPALTLIFALAVIGAGVARYVLMWAQTRLSFAIGGDIGAEIYRRTLYQPYQVHLERNSSEIISAVTAKVRDLVNQTIGPVIALVSSMFLLACMSGLLVLVDPVIAGVAFAVFGGFYLVVALSVRKRLLMHGQTMAREQVSVVKALQEGLIGIRDVLLTGAQEVYLSAFRKADRPARSATANIIILSQAPRYAIEAVGMILVAMIAYLLVVILGKKDSALPILGALALGAQRMLPILQQAYWSYSQIYGGRASLSDVLGLLRQPLPARSGVVPAIEFERSIELNGVEFTYGNGRPVVLANVNLSIPKGAAVGVIGETGSGKSTLIDIIMGLLPPTSGALSVDGVPVGIAALEAWQRRVAHVPQTIFLTDGTVSENIAFGVPRDQIDTERVRGAAQLAQIASTIESWDRTYDAGVGERGVRLSGGQRQRIGIARALYRDADVVVFDEATSALDAETEATVMAAINGLGRGLTKIIVAHRLSTLENCDFIVEVSNGSTRVIQRNEFARRAGK